MALEDRTHYAASSDIDAGPLLQHFLAASVARDPQGLALDIPPGRNRPERQTLTYAEIDAASDRLAFHLVPLV